MKSKQLNFESIYRNVGQWNGGNTNPPNRKRRNKINKISKLSRRKNR